MPLTLPGRFAETMDRLYPGDGNGVGDGGGPVAVALSGGGDSTALLHLCADWARTRGIALQAVSVDHGLRPEAGGELDRAADQCKALGIAHSRLTWRGWDGAGNLQAAARTARYRLIADWARAHGIASVALGHTLDDQAETVLLRLARGSGVDGLSAMRPVRRADGVTWLRPLLGERRQTLRDMLTTAGIGWSEDPSNEDARFDRVRVRRALQQLEPLGIDAETLAQTAERMQSARAVLEAAAQNAAREIAHTRGGAVFLQTDPLMALPEETRHRLLIHALRWVASAAYGPRRAAMAEVDAAIRAGRNFTLHGCLIGAAKGRCVIAREPAAVEGLVARVGETWDNRWIVHGPAQGVEVRALGENGLKSCPDWRSTGLPRAVLLASPAVWRARTLVAAPLANAQTGWSAELIHPANHFLSSVLSH